MTKQIPLSKNLFAVVDDQDFINCNKFKWSVSEMKSGKLYAFRSFLGKTIYLHRFIMGEPEGLEIDHVDGDGLKCTRDNMRVATHSQNRMNNKIYSSNTSGYKGVGFHSQAKKWRAYIQIGYRQKSLGLFNDPDSAARAYDVAARKHFGKFANLNFPNEQHGH